MSRVESILQYVSDNPGVRHSDAARALGMSVPNFSQAVRKLGDKIQSVKTRRGMVPCTLLYPKGHPTK